ncbi:hypothetical protein FBU30_001442 [Linnemannia zychae]|nr:hypothetical protein FBU30_001442 [Linnemannia zychae]
MTGLSALSSEKENLSEEVSNYNAVSGSNIQTALTTKTTAAPDSTSSVPIASPDLIQHCLLFPTYATRHSRSGSKDPDDWNIRVRGWAFSKRSNRRNRLVMSMARKIAGVTKDEKVYETLESRFSMFLTSNTQGAQFNVQCVGPASTTHMELTGGADSANNPTVNVLMDEIKSSESESGQADVDESISGQDFAHHMPRQDSSNLQTLPSNTSEQGKISPSLQNTTITTLKSQLSEQVQAFSQEEQRKLSEREAQPRDVTPSSMNPLDAGVQEFSHDGDVDEGHPSMLVVGSVETESKLSTRLSRGTALFKNVVKKVKTSAVYSSQNGASSDSLGLSSTIHNHSDTLSVENPRPIIRTRDHTRHEDLGHGVFPTVQVASRPGGHFDGTLRMSNSEVEAHRSEDISLEHPRFLKLRAHHDDMIDPCYGVVNLIDPVGVSVISDIDDTIKETNVTAGARIILRNTFLKDMMEVEGMASVYKSWWKQGAAIHYVSNSPWQLIPSLLEFFHTYMFPPGSAHLRLHDNMLKTYFAAPGENKRRSIREILADFPDRKFILVGDSGEIDMEIYTEMALEFPKQIVKIFIRDITTARLKEMIAKIPPTRSSNANTIGSVTGNTTTSTMSGTDDDYDNNDDDVNDDTDYSNTNNSGNHQETFETGITNNLKEFKLERPHHLRYTGSMSPRLDPSGPLTPPTMSLSTTPTSSTASSPRLQPKQITATVKAVLGSTFKRSSLSNNNNTTTNGNNKQAALNGWNNIRNRGGSKSPASPLSEGIVSMTGYPFPKVGSATSSSISSASGSQQRSRNNSGVEENEHYSQSSAFSYSSNYSSNHDQDPHKSSQGSVDIFDDHDHHHIMLQQQQQHYQQRSRKRTNTFSFMSITNSPPRSPKIPIRRTTAFIPRYESYPPETAMSAASPMDDSLNMKSVDRETNGQGRGTEPRFISPSPPFSSSPAATTPTSSTTSKNLLDVWLERVEQCRKRLPNGMLTLFESAEELEQCEIVQATFMRYGNSSRSSSSSSSKESKDDESNYDKNFDNGHKDHVSFETRSELSTESDTTMKTIYNYEDYKLFSVFSDK